MKIVLLLAFVVATLFGETEKTTTFKNMDIIAPYKEMKEGLQIATISRKVLQ